MGSPQVVPMEWLLSQLTSHVYAKLAGILLLCGLGVPIPEDISLISAGYLAHLGTVDLHAVFLVCFAAVLGGAGVTGSRTSSSPPSKPPRRALSPSATSPASATRSTAISSAASRCARSPSVEGQSRSLLAHRPDDCRLDGKLHRRQDRPPHVSPSAGLRPAHFDGGCLDFAGL